MDPPIYPGELMRRLVLTALTAQPQPGDQADADQVLHGYNSSRMRGAVQSLLQGGCSAVCSVPGLQLEGKGSAGMWRLLLNSVVQAARVHTRTLLCACSTSTCRVVARSSSSDAEHLSSPRSEPAIRPSTDDAPSSLDPLPPMGLTFRLPSGFAFTLGALHAGCKCPSTAPLLTGSASCQLDSAKEVLQTLMTWHQPESSPQYSHAQAWKSCVGCAGGRGL